MGEGTDDEGWLLGCVLGFVLGCCDGQVEGWPVGRLEGAECVGSGEGELVVGTAVDG